MGWMGLSVVCSLVLRCTPYRASLLSSFCISCVFLYFFLFAQHSSFRCVEGPLAGHLFKKNILQPLKTARASDLVLYRCAVLRASTTTCLLLFFPDVWRRRGMVRNAAACARKTFFKPDFERGSEALVPICPR